MENRLVDGPFETWITPGQHFSTPGGEYVEMKHGQSYAVGIENTSRYRCATEINIDGKRMGEDGPKF